MNVDVLKEIQRVRRAARFRSDKQERREELRKDREDAERHQKVLSIFDELRRASNEWGSVGNRTFLSFAPRYTKLDTPERLLKAQHEQELAAQGKLLRKTRGKPRHGYTGHPVHQMWLNMRNRGRLDKVWKDFEVFLPWAKDQFWEPGARFKRFNSEMPHGPYNSYLVAAKNEPYFGPMAVSTSADAEEWSEEVCYISPVEAYYEEGVNEEYAREVFMEDLGNTAPTFYLEVGEKRFVRMRACPEAVSLFKLGKYENVLDWYEENGSI